MPAGYGEGLTIVDACGEVDVREVRVTRGSTRLTQEVGQAGSRPDKVETRVRHCTADIRFGRYRRRQPRALAQATGGTEDGQRAQARPKPEEEERQSDTGQGEAPSQSARRGGRARFL